MAALSFASFLAWRIIIRRSEIVGAHDDYAVRLTPFLAKSHSRAPAPPEG
jgi:hypothetical protein